MRPDLPAKHTPLARTDARIGLLFVLPALALFLVFRFGPALAGLALSLFKSGVGGPLTLGRVQHSPGWHAIPPSGRRCR